MTRSILAHTKEARQIESLTTGCNVKIRRVRFRRNNSWASKLDDHGVRFVGKYGDGVGIFGFDIEAVTHGDGGVFIEDGDLLMHDPLQCAALIEASL